MPLSFTASLPIPNDTSDLIYHTSSPQLTLLLVVAVALTALVVVQAMPDPYAYPDPAALPDPEAFADPDPHFWGGYGRYGYGGGFYRHRYYWR